MNDDQLRRRLLQAFVVETPDRVAVERIREEAAKQRARKRPFTLLARGIAAGAVCVASGLSFPIVSGNLFCRNLVQRIDRNEPYSMTITSLGDPRQIMRWDVVVSWGNYAVQDRSGQIWLLGSDGSTYSVDGTNKVSCYTGKGGKIGILQDSSDVLKRVSKWDLNRRVRSEGTTLDDGQTLDRYRLSAEAGSPPIEVDEDPSTGLPVTALIGSNVPGEPTWNFECRYRFDGVGSENEFRALADSFTHLIDLTHPEPVASELEKRPLLRLELGRDRLTVYDLKRMRSGAVFLLYTFSGYHDGQVGSFLRLRDREGRDWLPEPVGMGGKFKLAGHTPVGEVFFPPADAPMDAVPTDLYCLANQWELEPEIPMNPLGMPGYAPRTLGRLTPALAPRPPDWFYFDSLSWFNFADFAPVMQAHAALQSGKFALAARLDAVALERLKDASNPFFFSRAEVLLDLCLAHEGLHRHDLAQKDAQDAKVALAEEPGQSFRVMRGIEACCKREGVR